MTVFGTYAVRSIGLPFAVWTGLVASPPTVAAASAKLAAPACNAIPGKTLAKSPKWRVVASQPKAAVGEIEAIGTVVACRRRGGDQRRMRELGDTSTASSTKAQVLQLVGDRLLATGLSASLATYSDISIFDLAKGTTVVLGSNQRSASYWETFHALLAPDGALATIDQKVGDGRTPLPAGTQLPPGPVELWDGSGHHTGLAASSLAVAPRKGTGFTYIGADGSPGTLPASGAAKGVALAPSKGLRWKPIPAAKRRSGRKVS